MNTTKKLLALILGAVILLGLLAGCGETASDPTPSKTPVNTVPTLSGMLVLSAEASFKISYDQNGMVMELTASNDPATEILEGYTSEGKSCDTVVKELLTATAEATLLRDAHNIVLKLAVGSDLPSETFLTGLEKSAAEVAAANASAAKVFAIGLDGLDAEGYINAENAQALLLNQLGVEKFDSLNGDASPRNDCYTFSVVYGGEEGHYIIDAVTGLIEETVVDDSEGEPEYIEEEEFDTSFEEEAIVPGEDFEEEPTPAEDPAV